MFQRLKRFFGMRSDEKTVSQKLLSNILMSSSSKDYFRVIHGKN
ncbi:MAG: hypothetical protein V4655_07665 [Bdellovibrionota bacterium]